MYFWLEDIFCAKAKTPTQPVKATVISQTQKRMKISGTRAGTPGIFPVIKDDEDDRFWMFIASTIKTPPV